MFLFLLFNIVSITYQTLFFYPYIVRSSSHATRPFQFLILHSHHYIKFCQTSHQRIPFFFISPHYAKQTAFHTSSEYLLSQQYFKIRSEISSKNNVTYSAKSYRRQKNKNQKPMKFIRVVNIKAISLFSINLFEQFNIFYTIIESNADFAIFSRNVLNSIFVQTLSFPYSPTIPQKYKQYISI